MVLQRMEIAPRTHLIDIEYLGRPSAIASCILETDDGLAVIDPGPRSSLDGLFRGMERDGLPPSDIRHILLTHIHLDHAGATGELVRRDPRISVYVHQRGARHVIDPSKLMASALRIYGDSLDRLFGEVLPLPAANVRVLVGGESVVVGGRTFRVEYTPGHAAHHISWLDEATGTAFVGDTAGERFAPSQFVLPVAPPPDIDLDAWRETTVLLKSWQAASLVVTHFGAYPDSTRHLDEHLARLEQWADAVRRSLAEDGSDAERAGRFADRIGEEIRRELTEDQARHYVSGGLRDTWAGLARYWRKRDG
jgi:glyoxylase-like metal-dependent hydrolase (beta-lactamase superfamily II)